MARKRIRIISVLSYAQTLIQTVTLTYLLNLRLKLFMQCNQYSAIPWREMAGMRDIVVHEYDQLNLDIIWDIIANKLPELARLSIFC
jgi:uncharacterized protein YutE (UPF0331/DUF86 family)